MQPRVVSAGPLVAGTTTKIGLTQSPAAAGYLALNGAVGAAVANNICLSQSGTTATALLLNGALAQTRFTAPTIGTGATLAWLATPGPIYITSAADDSAITFAVVGLDVNNATITETMHGTNTSVVASAKVYRAVLSITPSGNTTGAVTVGAMGFATLDTARNVIFQSSGNDTGLTITISGTDWAGTPISESVTGASGAAASTVLDYLTVTQVKVSGASAGTISVGTNGVAGSPWINLDTWANGTVAGQVDVSGTANYTVQWSNDDPNSYANAVARASMTWGSFPGMVAQTTSMNFSVDAASVWFRLLLNSGSGSAKMTLAQHSAVPY